MSSRKDQDLKDFLIATRKKSSSGVSSAPIWVVQKKGERIWNPKAKRHWRSTELGSDFRKRRASQKKALRRRKD